MPRFTHDCDRCKFLGTIKDSDYYVCQSTYIIRDGDEGSNYRAVPKELLHRAGDDFRRFITLDPADFK